MNTKNATGWVLRPVTRIRAGVIALMALCLPVTGCITPDANVAAPTNAANTGVDMANSARTRCPAASAAIADAEAAAREAHAAAAAVNEAGEEVDAADDAIEEFGSKVGPGGTTAAQRQAAASAARAKYAKAVDNASAKTAASRAANSRLAAACPEAQNDVYPEQARLPGSQPPGLDIFRGTTSHGQEPPSNGGGNGHHHED